MWEEIEKSQRGGRSTHPDWKKYPAIRITRHSVNLSPPFVESYGCDGMEMKIFVDVENKRCGFKVVSQTGEDFKVQKHYKGNGRGSPTWIICCSRLQKAFKEYHGMSFRAILNPESRVIEVSLSPSNELGAAK